MAVTVLAAIAQTVIQGGGWAMFFKTLAVTAGLSAVSRALTPKVNGSMLKGTNVTSREPTASRKIVYGRSRVGGTVAYIETNNNGSGSANEYLHLVIALAGHEIDAYEEVYFNEKKIWDNGSYLLTWGDYVHIGFHKGDQTTADADLVASSNKWTSNHVLNGTAYLYVRLKYDPEQFAQGLPNISAVIRGKKVYNPTTDVTEWSQNPALCIRDYLLDSRYGLAESALNINATALASAQSICDQSVLLDSGASHLRYVLDGVVDTSESRKNNIEAMLSAMGGKLIYSGGQYFVSAAAYSAPTVSIDESVLSGTISVQTKQSRRTLYNGVKGVFVSEEDNYIVSDYPSITSSAYSAEDGEPIFLDMVLPFTTNNVRAQRLAKLALLQSRQQTSITLPCNLAALKFKAGDNISVSNTRLGYTNKVFEVIGYDMTLADDGSIVVEVNAIETDSSIYDWTTSDEQEFITGGEVDIYSGETIAPTNVVANAEQYVNGMGVPTPQIGVTFTASDDAFIDHYIVSWKATSQTEYRSLSTVEPRATIQGIKSGNTYNVNVKAVNQFGIPSPEVAASNVAIPSTASSDVIMYAGNENAQGSNFYVDATGHAHAKDITIYSDTGAVFFSSATGFTDEALTQISTVTGTPVTTLSNSLLDDADVETIILVAETDLTIKAKLNSAFFGSSTVSGADALADIPENFTVKILYKEQSAGSYTQLASQTYTRTTGTPTATQYQAQTSVFDLGSEINAYSYITRSLGSVDADGFSILTATLNDLAGAGTGTTYLFKTEISTTDASYNTNDNHVDSNADRIISITSGGTGFYVENGTGSQGVPEGDITAVIAGTNLTGGGTSGDVTLSLSSTISGNHTFSNNLTVSGDLTVNGTITNQFDGLVTFTNLNSELANASSTEITTINGGLLKTGTIEGDRIRIDGVGIDFVTNGTEKTLQIGDDGVTTVKIDDLAVSGAKIANLAVTEDKIADLAVDTLKIANQAVSIPTGAYTAANFYANPYHDSSTVTYEEVQSVTFTQTAVPTCVFWSFFADISSGDEDSGDFGYAEIHVRLTRNNVVIVDYQKLDRVYGVDLNKQENISGSFIHTGSVGSATYKLEVGRKGDYGQVSKRSLITMALKK